MRIRSLLTILFLVFWAVPLAAQEPSDTVSTGISWFNSLAEAKPLADSSKRQVLLALYTDWCRWCRVMDESTFADPGVIDLEKRLVFVRVDAEIDTATARRFAVWAYPTMVLTNSEGQEVDRVVGYVPPAQFRQTIVDYLEGHGVLWDWEQRARDKPGDPSAAFAQGEIYMRRGDFAKARGQFDQVLTRDPKNSSGRADDALFAMGMMHRREESWYKAIEEFKQIAKKFSKSEWLEDAAIYIPWLYAQAGDTSEALRHYRAFLKDFKGSQEREWVEGRIRQLEPQPAEPTQ
ncbi:MAG: tetratricopeptide repeat protein [Candidatus Zixiibacteriota bacterium]